MESIPNDSGLTDIVPVAMVKPLALPDQTSGHALFKYVIPKGVLEAKLRFTDQLNSQCTMITQEAENATNNARGQLSSVGLPGSLEAVKSQSPLPDSLWDKVQRVQKMGGVARLESMIGDVSHYAKRAYSTMCSIDDSLSREMNKDDGFRARNPDYPGVPSSKMNVDILANASKMREAYVNAQDSDKSINNDLQDPATREMLSILSKTKGDLFKMFPSNSAPNLLDFDEELDKSGVLGKDGIQLEAKLEELAELIENRSKLLDSLPQIVSTDYNEITLSAVSRGEDVYSKYEEILKNVTMIHSQVVHSVAQQKSLLDEIMALNDRFARTKDSSPLAVEKGKVIAKIEQSAAKYFSLYSKITAGVTFYSNLQVRMLNVNTYVRHLR